MGGSELSQHRRGNARTVALVVEVRAEHLRTTLPHRTTAAIFAAIADAAERRGV